MNTNTNSLIPFKKVWNTADRKYGEKTHWLNPQEIIRGVEPCKVNKNGEELECTKVFYTNSYVTLLGTPEEFFAACREGNTAVCLIQEIERNGLTIKEFLKQLEGFNGIQLT